MSDAGNKRQTLRQPVLKAAKVRFGDAVVDCLVLDLSQSGLRVSTEAFMPFPDEVTIELRSGGMWRAVRRWQRGMETGFEFTRFAGLHAQAVADASLLYGQLLNSGLRDLTGRLAELRHFDHPELKAAAEAADAAVEALERVLKAATGRG